MKLRRLFYCIIVVGLLSTGVERVYSANLYETNFNFKKKKKTKPVEDTVKSSEKEYKKFFKDKHTTVSGLIKMHKMNNKLYFELPLSLLEKEMLLGSTVSEISDNTNAIIGSKPTEPLHFKFSKIGNQICLRSAKMDVINGDNDSRIQQSIDNSNIGAIIDAFKISVYSPDSSAVVFEVTNFFAGDNKLLTPFDKYSFNLGKGGKRSEIFKSDKSYVDEIKAFEDNVSIKSYLSYTYSISGGKGASIKDEPFTARMTRSIILLDSIPKRPRITDSRIAIFPTRKVNYSKKEQRSKEVYYANRWSLEPIDTLAYRKGEKTEVKQPIIFYIDDNFPEDWKDALREGVNQWSELFDEIGLKNAIQAKDYPKDDPEFDPDNIKYSCIRYAPLRMANAMGPSWVDPRSGEIINASVYVYHDVVKLLSNWLFVQTSQTDSRVRTTHLPKEILADALRYVVSHEVGHCLGFMHNMSASSVIPVDSLRSSSFTQKYGTTTSIMDYARFNYVAQPGDMERGVKLTPPRFGEYDKFLIKWAYTPVFDVNTAEEEYVVTSKWLQEASENPVLRYGKQQFSETIDPKSQSEDLGDDAIKASTYGIKNLKYILSNLNEWLAEDDMDYQRRSDLYDAIVMQYYLYMTHVYANIGGINMNEKHVGDLVTAYQSIPREKQKEALTFMLEQIYDLKWIDNEALMKNFQIMGSPAGVLRNLLFKQILDSEDRIGRCALVSDDPYQVEEYMEDVYQFVWKPTIQGKSLNETDIQMQKAFVTRVSSGAGIKLGDSKSKSLYGALNERIENLLANEMVSKTCSCDNYHSSNHSFSVGELSLSSYDEPEFQYFVGKNSSPLHYSYLLKIRDLIKRRVNSSDKQTKLHYELMIHEIEKALK